MSNLSLPKSDKVIELGKYGFPMALTEHSLKAYFWQTFESSVIQLRQSQNNAANDCQRLCKTFPALAGPPSQKTVEMVPFFRMSPPLSESFDGLILSYHYTQEAGELVSNLSAHPIQSLGCHGAVKRPAITRLRPAAHPSKARTKSPP